MVLTGLVANGVA